jgi:hypothetical protein
MKYSIREIDFHSCLILTDKNVSTDGIEIVNIGRDIDLIEYNRICINELHKYVNTDYCLVIQWDGFVIDPQRWSEEFFNYDYIGSNWIIDNPKINTVGNGGFSLRSKKFLEVSSKLEYTPHACNWLSDSQKYYMPITPEDWFLCFDKYDYMIQNGIKFADKSTADKFSVEHPRSLKPFNRNDINTYKSFGFHGSFNKAAMELLNAR